MQPQAFGPHGDPCESSPGATLASVGPMQPRQQTVRIPRWAQGRPGFGQGGWSSAQFATAIGEPVTIDLRSGVPLEEDLAVLDVDGGWELRHGDTVIMAARPRDVVFATVQPVSIAEAVVARSGFDLDADSHNAPDCFSCGVREHTMRMHPGAVPGGEPRVASDWTPPAWVGDDDGVVDEAVVWTVMDCAQGFFVGRIPERRSALTVRYAAEVLAPVRVGQTYAVVAGPGHWPRGWDGRKRGAAAVVLAEDGTVVARADSLWVAPRES